MGRVVILIEADNTDSKDLEKIVEELAPAPEYISKQVEDEVHIYILSDEGGLKWSTLSIST